MSRFRSTIGIGFASATLMAVTLGAPGTARAEPPQTPEAKAAALITPAVVYMDMNFKARVVEVNNGEAFTVTTRCTGFAVSADGYIGTAGHCVDPAEQRDEVIKNLAKEMDGQGGKTADQWAQFGATNWTYQVEQNGTTPDREVLVSGAGQPKDAKPLPARVVDFRPLGEGDVGLLKIELGDKSIPVAELAQKGELQVGDPILAVGYPASTDKVTDFTLVPAVKSGTISAQQTWKTQPLLQISAPTSAGMSGGPTVDMQARVVGIISFKPSEEEQAFNFISPVQALNELIKDHGVDAELGPADTAFRNGLNDLNNGNYTGAIDNLSTALALSPDYPGARDLQRQAIQLRSQAGDTPTGSGPKAWMFVVAFVAIVALIGSGVLVFALSRRNKEPAMAGGGSWPGASGPAGAAAPPRPPNVGMGAPAGATGGPSPVGGAPPPPSGGGEINCSNCGYGLAPGAGFCPRCGKPQR
jgi:serine protease Do